MARSAMFRRLQWMVRVSEEADRRGIDPAEAVELAHGGELWAPTRRRLLKGAGLAAAGMALTPARAFAASSPTAPKIAVVGAGLAGLACVDTLRSKGVAATLFEASDRAGGRCWTLGGAFGGPVDFPGQVAERGGEFIDTTHGTMRRWATEFGLDLETVEPAGETLYQFGGTLHDEAEVVAEYRLLVDALRDDLRTIGSPTATSFTDADRLLDETDLATYLRTRGAGGLIAAVLEAAYRGEFGLELSEQSALSLLLFIHADRRSKFRPFGVFSDERFHVIGGNQQIVAGLTARNASSLRLGHRLVAVTETSTGKVRLTFETGRRLVEDTFDRVVLAVPFPVLRGVDLSGFPLPTWKRRAIDELRYGTNSKHLIGFTGRPWQAPSVGGNGSIYADLARLQNTWETNQSLGDASRGVLTSFTGGVRGRAIDPRRVDAETAVFLADLDRIVPGASSAVRQNRGRYVAHIENWSRSPYQLGSYTANHPGYFTTICDLEAPPVRALHFAGEHTSSFYEWQGFMEGGALSGLRAAAEVYAAVR